MTPGKFLRLLWPDTGFYCIAHPFTPAGSNVQTYIHKVFPTISAAVTHVHEMMHTADVYFAVLSLEAAQVWNPDKDNYKTGTKGGYSQRTAENMLASKAAFFDIDVGSEAGKYPTQREALLALTDFLTKTKLPMPTLVSSGGGVHTYWHFDRAVPRDEWREMAWHMRQLAEGLTLKVDPMRTTDSTSVLRVPDTFNWKDRNNPRPVKVLQEGAVTHYETFLQMLSDAMVAHGVVPTPAPTRAAPKSVVDKHGLGTQAAFSDFGPPPTLDDLGAACAQVRKIIRSQVDKTDPDYGPLDNNQWYRGMLATLKHVEDGAKLCHTLTNLHPRSVSDTDAKLHQLESYGPARCKTLQEIMPWKDAPCQSCRFLNNPSVPNPLVAVRRTKVAPPPGTTASPGSETPPSPSPVTGSTTSAPPMPTMAQLVPPGMALQAAMVPNPPWPYERLDAGGVQITRKDKDGNTTSSMILAHDLYPIKRLANLDEGREQQVWRVTLPRSGFRDFVIDADVLYDSRKFCVAIANNGIYPNKAEIPALQDYMVAYISQLQKEADADKQSSHLGWSDEYREFILPDKILLTDGTVRACSLTEAARRSVQFLRKKGDLHEQVKLMQFYNKPGYIANQSVILDSLGSIIYYATGHSGIVVNCSGDAGASKSTTLYTGASLWGDPMLLPINGTNRGATANARTQRITTNANLPTFVDEITHMPAREAADLVMNITQPGHRLRLAVDGTERTTADNYKSAIMITTANASLHALLSTDNTAGTAGSMRVFEMKFVAQHIHTKDQADEFLRNLRLHHGHIGEIFAQFVIRNRVAVERRVQQVVREIDQAAGIQSSERFWSARVACVIVAGEICQALNLLPYAVDPIRQWAIHQQIPYMRGVVREEYRDPLAVLSDYIAEKQGNIIVVDKIAGIGMNTAGVASVNQSAFSINTVNGALLGHYDLKLGVLYLLKQGFKDHCHRIGAIATRIIDDLALPRINGDRIIIDKEARRTLGAGTPLAKGQTRCIAIDMTHPEIAGVKPTLVANNVPAAPANDESKTA